MFRAYLELVRLPAVFTALADALMAFFFVHTIDRPGRPEVLALLVAATCLMYMAGMALNDVFDRDIDARERPRRPIPSGRIRLETARGLGAGMLLGGLACAWGVTFLTQQPLTGGLGTLLAALVAAYDGFLKRTPLGPIAMGGCRLLNLLMGMSTAGAGLGTIHFAVAGGYGVYIAGVTWFARYEAEQSPVATLIAGWAVMAAGLGILVALPWWFPADGFGPVPSRMHYPAGPWQGLAAALSALILWRALSAVLDRRPERVQAAVRNSLLSLIVLDGAVSLAVRGMWPSVWIVLLAVPAVALGRWLYAT